MERVKTSFGALPFVGSIEVIPTEYLKPHGGFANLDQVARMFNVEVMAMVSYDQVQFNDSNAFSLLYWTIVGADGDQPGQSRRIVGPILNHHSTRKPSYFMQDLL